ncbi:apolipo L3-like protein [Labeo rohita]|uniref:Apolipo L3-like protein n=1 Tax=Labeo rohita TaxID=84645 RepID=A0A498NKG0_LABRO|nr:apolipo L3-like protein [Labeo rohita]
MHKKTTEGSLTGAALGAAGGITSTAGLCLAPFTFGASLALTGVGAAAGIVGGATIATCTITNMIKQKNLRETIEKIINDAQNTIKSMIEQLSKISDNIEETEQLEETMNQEGVKTARGATDISELKHEIGKVSALADKENQEEHGCPSTSFLTTGCFSGVEVGVLTEPPIVAVSNGL